MDALNYINDLFAYLETYETKYAQFETEAFLQTYNGIYAVFGTLRHQKEKAVEVDSLLFEKIKTQPLNSSDLRELSVQILVSYFESVAVVEGQNNRAYPYCRGVRPIKQDIAYMANHLVPKLFQTGSLNGNFRLHVFFLGEIARFASKFGSPIDAGLSPEALQAMSLPHQLLELGRRRLEFGNELLRDRNSLEYTLQKLGYFDKQSKIDKLAALYFGEWGYVTEIGFWDRVKASFSGMGRKFRGSFSSNRYFWLTMTQRKAAYGLYAGIIIVSIALAILVPKLWSSHTQHKLQEFQEEYVTSPANNSPAVKTDAGSR